MSNHPNRGQRRGPFASPTSEEVRAARQAAGLTQSEAAVKIRGTLRSWQRYEGVSGTPDHRRMHPGLFELFLIKTGQPLPEWLKRPTSEADA